MCVLLAVCVILGVLLALCVCYRTCVLLNALSGFLTDVTVLTLYTFCRSSPSSANPHTLIFCTNKFSVMNYLFETQNYSN